MDYPATHRVRHVDGWEVDLYLSDQLLRQLADRDDDARLTAYSQICVRFKAACIRKYPELPWGRYHHILWRQLSFNPLEVQAAPPAPVPAASSDECCDDDDCREL